jgi:hypothetical protein
MKKKLDEEDVEALMESIEKMDKVWTYCMDISGVLLKAMSAEVSPLIQSKLLPLFAAKLGNINKMKEYEILEALCMVVDCLEYGTDELYTTIAG